MFVGYLSAKMRCKQATCFVVISGCWSISDDVWHSCNSVVVDVAIFCLLLNTEKPLLETTPTILATFFLLWPWTLTYDLDLLTYCTCGWSRTIIWQMTFDHGERSFRSKASPDTQRDPQTANRLLYAATKVVGKNEARDRRSLRLLIFS